LNRAGAVLNRKIWTHNFDVKISIRQTRVWGTPRSTCGKTIEEKSKAPPLQNQYGRATSERGEYELTVVRARDTLSTSGHSLLCSPNKADSRPDFNKGMRLNKTAVRLISILCFCVLPIPALAQCASPLCQALQNILDAAVTDFREYALDKTGGPEVSVKETKFACQKMAWANNVPMYMCYAQLPLATGRSSYESALAALKSLKPDWQFQINSPNDDHYVYAGPPDCENPPNDGPYIGQCPLHLQAVKQPDGTMKVHFWMNSLSSPYLVKRPPAPKTAPQTAANDCDDFCQKFKKAFVARMNSFEDIRTARMNGQLSDATVKLEGAKECVIKAAREPAPNEVGTQFVCYWPETSGAEAETRFRDLIARVQAAIPSDWSTRQENESDERTGARTMNWEAIEPGGKHDVRIYLLGDAVGLHITTWR
jgi:hypothetical protein